MPTEFAYTLYIVFKASIAVYKFMNQTAVNAHQIYPMAVSSNSPSDLIHLAQEMMLDKRVSKMTLQLYGKPTRTWDLLGNGEWSMIRY